MISWDIGLQVDRFNFGHHYQSSPVYLSYLLTSRGFVSPSIDQNFTACELGYNQCLSINLHALTVHGQWFGSDLDHQQVECAQNMAAQTELQPNELVLCNEPLDEFLKRTDLPEFSYICLQGVWSFISPETQISLVEFFKRKLKIGGVVYLSYHCDPGYTNFEPLVHLLASFNQTVNAQVSDPQERHNNLRKFLQELLRSQARGLFKDLSLKYKVEQILKNQDPKELAELLNPNWNTSNFKTVAGTLEQAKLNFACSASLYNLVDEVTLKADQKKFLAPVNGTEVGEVVRDFIVAPYDRHDVFVKGLRTLTFQEKISLTKNIHVMLAVPSKDLNYTFKGEVGTMELPRNVYEPIYQLLGDYQPHCLGEILAALNVEQGVIEEAIRTLVYLNKVFIVRDPLLVSAEEKQRCLNFNQLLLDDANNSSEFLVSPLMGCGVHVSPLNMKLLRLLRQHLKTEPNLDSLDLNQLTTDIGPLLPNPELLAASHEQKLAFVTEYVAQFKLNNLAIYKAFGLV